MLRFACFLSVILAVRSASAPYFSPCHAADSACLKSSAQQVVPVLAAGVPELGIQSLDPMHLEQVKTSQAGLDMDFRNTIVEGLRNCEVLAFKPTYLDLKCSVTMVGDYTLGGKLLILPIEGNGKYKITIHDIVVNFLFEVEEKVINGKTYWTVVDWKHTADVKTGAVFQFQNLFNGNQELSNTIHEFANSNWKEIFQKVAPPMVKAVVSKMVNESIKLFDKVPESEISLE